MLFATAVALCCGLVTATKARHFDRAHSSFAVKNLRTEYLDKPLGLDVLAPRFSWEVAVAAESNGTVARGVVQNSYRIIVIAEGKADSDPVWDSGVVLGDPIRVPYNGSALVPGSVYSWSVSIELATADKNTEPVHVQSSTTTFSIGLLTPSDWSGQFVGMSESNKSSNFAADPWFRKTFTLDADQVAAVSSGGASALLYVASLGFHEASVNGKPASETAVLVPSISYLPSRILYRTYNVTDLLDLSNGATNALGVWAAAGWAEYFTFEWADDVQFGGHAPLIMAELRIGGSVVNETATRDASWRVKPSTTSRLGDWGNGGFGGDIIDERLAIDGGWDVATLDDSDWETATAVTINKNMTVSADIMEPTVRSGDITATSITRIDAETLLVEMYELYTGWFEVSNLVGTAGDNVTFSVSTTKGVELEYNMQDCLIFKSSEPTSFRMRFSYHEIHYITIRGKLQTDLTVDDIVGYQLFSDLERHGAFTCESQLLTKIYDTTVNNYEGLTTGGQTVDCPHRERRGYGGDGHTSYEFALANYGVGAYFTKWARDFADVQTDDGNVPHTAPTVSGGGGPAWSGFVVTMPWQVYRMYGDVQLMADMYPTMTRQLAFFQKNINDADGLLHPWTTSQWDFLGDWITPHGSESNVTSPENILFNNCYFAYITRLTANIADILGYSTDAVKYNALAAALGDAIINAFYNSSTGGFVDLLQTHLAMPLATGVVSPGSAAQVVASLEQAIALTDGHLDTGLTGTYFMTKYLTESNRNDLVFTMTNQTTFPSYGYFLEQGYTTWPEQWDVTVPNLSLMHGCYNAIGLWFLEGVAGVTVDMLDGPLRFRAPVEIAEHVHWANGSRFALRGIARSSWQVNTGHATASFTHQITVPALTNGQVRIPVLSGEGVADVSVDGQPLDSPPPSISFHGMETIGSTDYVVLAVGSGDYLFSSNWTFNSL